MPKIRLPLSTKPGPIQIHFKFQGPFKSDKNNITKKPFWTTLLELGAVNVKNKLQIMIKFPQNPQIDLTMDVSDEMWETWLKKAIKKVLKQKQFPGLPRIYAAIRVIAESELPPSAQPPKGPETDLLFFNHVTEHLQRAVKKGIILRIYTKGNPAYRLASKSDRQLDLTYSPIAGHMMEMMQGVMEKCLKELHAGMSNFRRFSIDQITDYVRFSHKIKYDEEDEDEYEALQYAILAGLQRGVVMGLFQQFQDNFRIADEGTEYSPNAFKEIKVGTSKEKSLGEIPDMTQEFGKLFTKLKRGSQDVAQIPEKLNGIMQGPSEDQDEGTPSPESLEKREISKTLDEICEKVASAVEEDPKKDSGATPSTSKGSKRTIKQPDRFNPEPPVKKPRKKSEKPEKIAKDTLTDYFQTGDFKKRSYQKKTKRGKGRPKKVKDLQGQMLDTVSPSHSHKVKIFSDEESSDDDEVVCLEEINKPPPEEIDIADEYEEVQEKEEDSIKSVKSASIYSVSESEAEEKEEDREELMEVVELNSSTEPAVEISGNVPTQPEIPAKPESPPNSNEIRIKTVRSMGDSAQLVVRIKSEFNREVEEFAKIPTPPPSFSKREEMVFITNPEKLNMEPFNLGLMLMTDPDLCDVDLVVKDKVFRAHRIVLAAQSEYFSNMFKELPQKLPFSLDVGNPQAFLLVLNFLYKGHFGETVFLNPQSVCEFLGLADSFKLNRLRDYVKASIKAVGSRFDAQFGFKLLEYALLKNTGRSHFDSILALIKPIYGQIKNLPRWREYSLNSTYASIFKKFDQILMMNERKNVGISNKSPILPKINGSAYSNGNTKANPLEVSPNASILFQKNVQQSSSSVALKTKAGDQGAEQKAITKRGSMKVKGESNAMDIYDEN